jgi:hypothetical protein
MKSTALPSRRSEALLSRLHVLLAAIAKEPALPIAIVQI